MAHALNPFKTPPRAFISYARSDGADTAATLRARLEREQPEITLWLDRAQMVGGVGWWKQITEALDRVEILIMVLTPAAMQSEVAAKEWRYARQQGVRVCPVMQDVSVLDFQVLPNWMRKAHCYDLNREWETFVSFLQSAERSNRVPFMAPDLPDQCVDRPVQIAALLACLLDESGVNPQFATTALQGSGGYGKTTLASIVCHHEQIISNYDDGVLWVSLGETPNVQGELTKLYAALTGERPSFIDIDDASIQLAERLDQKNCLLVVDDVWDPNHLRPFLRGGRLCSRLITTRHLRVVIEVGASRTVVDKMTQEQALEMLTARLKSRPVELEALRVLATRLDEWPLLLKLAGSQLRERMERGDSLAGALAYINRAMDKKGVVAFDRTLPSARHDAVASTVAASLELFSPENQTRFAQLAIFRNDVSFPVSAVATLWGLDEFDTEDLILHLDDAALLEFDLKTGGIRLHGVLRAYLESQLKNVRLLHLKLVEAWLSEPNNLPDLYAWKWVGWHLVQAGEHSRLQQLLLDFDWLQARLEAIQVQSILQDFEWLDDGGDTRLMRDTLRLASSGLAFDAYQLRLQIGGRLDPGHSLTIDALLKRADASGAGPRLVLAESSLTHPGGAMTDILKSHSGAVEALAISPDGQRLVSASEDWTLRLWDLRTNRVIRTFEGHTGAVHTVAFLADGESIISGSEDRMLRLWDVGTGREKAALRGHTLAVQDLAVSADGKLVASVSEDGSVRVWDLETKKNRILYKGRGHQLNAIVITPDGRSLVFGAGDWTIRLIALEDGTETVLEGHAGVVRCLAVTVDGTRLLSGADDGVVRIWALDTGQSLIEMTGHATSVDAVALAQDGKRAISGSRDKTLRVWNLETGQEQQVLEGHSGFIRSIVTSPITGQVISGSTDRTIRNWNIESSSSNLPAHSGHKEAVALLSISADGERVVSGTRTGELLLWDSQYHKQDVTTHQHNCNPTPQVMGRLSGHTHWVQSLRMTGDGKWVITGSRDRTLRVWGVEQQVSQHQLKGHLSEVYYLDVTADGRRVLSVSRDRTLRVWDVQAGRCLRVLVYGRNKRALSSLRVNNAMLAEMNLGPQVDIARKLITRYAKAAISPDGGRVLIESQGNLCVWDLHDGSTWDQELGDLDVVAFAFQADSKSVVLGTLFGQLLVWDFEQEPKLFEGHRNRILDLAVTPDGKTIISAARDDTIRIWDQSVCRERSRITGHAGKVDAVAIAQQGQVAYSVYGDTLVVYDLGESARIASLTFDHQITTIAVTPSGKRVVIGDQSGRIHYLSL
ncbi:MAG: NB-ARC domain-containing protein [Pseudomonadota bacterium]